MNTYDAIIGSRQAGIFLAFSLASKGIKDVFIAKTHNTSISELIITTLENLTQVA